MNPIKNIFLPLSVIKGRTVIILIVVECILALSLWQFTAHGGLLPTPAKVAESFLSIVSTGDFWDNFIHSMGLTLKGMGISIIIALLVCYLSLLPVFAPIAKFVIKCRYLTLTGLIFVFTLLTQNGAQLKLGLLIFGIVPFFVTSFLSIIDSINSQEYELCKTLRMNNWKALFEVVIIGRLDQVFEVLRQNFAIAWMMITMVEGLSMSEGGLGVMLIKSNKYLDLGSVFGILVIIFIIGILFDYLLANLRHWFFPYTKLQVRK